MKTIVLLADTAAQDWLTLAVFFVALGVLVFLIVIFIFYKLIKSDNKRKRKLRDKRI